jgi:predicted nucleic acid-binding protein
MKILIDACVWSLVLRRSSRAILSSEEQQIVALLSDAIHTDRAVLIGPIRQEILSGIKDPAKYEKLRHALTAYPDVPLTAVDYEEAARLFNVCRASGVQCGAVDILLCAVARRRNWAILTFDRGLKRCIEVLN